MKVTLEIQKQENLRFFIKFLFLLFIASSIPLILFIYGKFSNIYLIIIAIIVPLFGLLIFFSLYKFSQGTLPTNQKISPKNKKIVLSFIEGLPDKYFRSRFVFLPAIFLLFIVTFIQIRYRLLFIGILFIYYGGLIAHSAYKNNEIYQYSTMAPIFYLRGENGEKDYVFFRKIQIALGIFLSLVGIFAVIVELLEGPIF